MIGISGDARIFVFSSPTDMRKSFQGLSKVIYDYEGVPHDGAYYVFLNKPKNKVKILYWDGDGFAMWYKSLQKGCFLMNIKHGQKEPITRRTLSLILEGVEPLKVKARFSLK